MTFTVAHTFTSTTTDTTSSGTSGGLGIVGPAEWNANHTLSGTLTSSQLPTDVAYLDVADQTLSGGANVTSFSISSSSAITIDCGKGPLQYVNNSGAFTVTAPSNDGSTMLLMLNKTGAGSLTLSGFNVGSNTGDATDTTSGHNFTISIWRINSVSGYRIAAHQ